MTRAMWKLLLRFFSWESQADVMEDVRFIRSFEISMLLLFYSFVFSVCFQAAGPHVERCLTGFNVPCSQH